jgi:lysophospholipase L1-like esterase
MQRYLPELVALPLLPFLLLQGRRTRRITPRLPEAAGPNHGIAGSTGSGHALRVLAIGESPVAGVGVETQEQAITACFAQALSARSGRPVAWQAVGKNGITASEAVFRLLPLVDAAPVDVALICFGVNDTTAFSPVERWKKDLNAIIDAVGQRCSPRLILLSGVPPMSRFPALPQPLRWVLGLKAATLDRASVRVAAALPSVIHVPLQLDPLAPGMMAHDGYHPSAAGCIAWADMLAELSMTRLS